MQYPIGSFPFLDACPELTLERWTKRYGKLFSLRLGNQLFVVVSEPGIAKDLLVTQGAIFSSRKYNYIKSGIVLEGGGITGTPYNEQWSVLTASG